jgi:hypothetical protein
MVRVLSFEIVNRGAMMIAVERYGDGSQEMTFPRGKVLVVRPSP